MSMVWNGTNETVPSLLVRLDARLALDFSVLRHLLVQLDLGELAPDIQSQFHQRRVPAKQVTQFVLRRRACGLRLVAYLQFDDGGILGHAGHDRAEAFISDRVAVKQNSLDGAVGFQRLCQRDRELAIQLQRAHLQGRDMGVVLECRARLDLLFLIQRQEPVVADNLHIRDFRIVGSDLVKVLFHLVTLALLQRPGLDGVMPARLS
mmetsp:Transcript_13992/g.38451  ORF Transcript_13992/g.38451 Transcript_13992/m.38451 type:complete len:206 (-) Transcript_13992:47-664(-)